MSVRRLLDAPRTTRWLWVFAFLLALPTIGLGHVLDDLQQRGMLRGNYDAARRSPGDLYCFSLGPGQGLDPALLSWWDYEDSSLCFLRPLSSWSLWLDHTFLWELPALTHLHSVLWFMLLWLGWRRILLRYLPTDIANLALLLTAASGFMSLSTAWVAARHVLVGGSLTVWGLHHALHGRDARRPARELLGMALIGVSLLASEMALGTFAFLVAREWFARGGTDAQRRPGWAVRLVAYAGLGFSYVAVHGSLGYGAPHYPLYLDPFGDPLTFLRAAPERLLGLTGELVAGLPSEFWLYPSLRPLMALCCAFVGAMFAVALRSLFRAGPQELTRELRWLGVGALLSLAPCVSGMQGGRSLTVAGFPLFALTAACLLRLSGPHVLEAPMRGSPSRGKRPKHLTAALMTLAAGGFVGNPLAHVGWYVVVAGLDHAEEQLLDRSQVDCPPASDVYLIDASQVGASAWYARFWLQELLAARNFRQLTMIPTGISAIELRRTGPATLELAARGGPLVGPMAVPRGSEDRIQPGFQRRYPDYRVRVEQRSALGPSAITVQFARPLDDRGLCLFVHDDMRLYQITPPAVGAQTTIRPTPPF